MKKCSQCGDCCSKHPCGIALSIIGDARPCKALELNDDGSFSCGLLRHAHKYISQAEEKDNEILRFVFAKILGIGYGCCDSPEHADLIRSIVKSFKLKRGDRVCKKNVE